MTLRELFDWLWQTRRPVSQAEPLVPDNHSDRSTLSDFVRILRDADRELSETKRDGD